MEYEENGGGGDILFWAFGWGVLVFLVASTWHLWRYFNGSDDDHGIIHAKCMSLCGASMIGCLLGTVLAVVLYGVIKMLGFFLFGPYLSYKTTWLICGWAVCVQATSMMYLLDDRWDWRKELKKNEDG